MGWEGGSFGGGGSFDIYIYIYSVYIYIDDLYLKNHVHREEVLQTWWLLDGLGSMLQPHSFLQGIVFGVVAK